MQVISAIYNTTNKIIKVTDSGGQKYHIKVGNLEAYDRFGLQEWLDAGNTISDYVDPMTPYQHWNNEISKLDKDMPRSLEDMLDGMPDKSGVAQITLDRLQAKKDLRATKP